MVTADKSLYCSHEDNKIRVEEGGARLRKSRVGLRDVLGLALKR